MPEKNHLWPEETSQENDSITLAATLERSDGARQRLWYRLPGYLRTALAKNCDPFLLGVLFNIMRTPNELVVHGRVSPSLLRNLVEFQEAWVSWLPGKYHCIAISADQEKESLPVESDETILTFSGGADSAYSAWRHRLGSAGRLRRKLTAGMMLHGFDIPLEETGIFARAAERSRRMLTSLGIELIPVETNFREVGGTWEDAHGAGLASALSLLQGRFRTGMIASSYIYSSLVLPCGSNPVTDGLMSSAAFQIVHDGAAVHKVDKLREISQWPEAMQYLRVCWSGEQKDRNCCRCQKCVWTMLSFRLNGMPLPECFEQDIDDRQILRLRYHDLGEVMSMERLVRRARSASISSSWVQALQTSIWLNRLRLAVNQSLPVRNVLRRVYRFILPPFQ